MKKSTLNNTKPSSISKVLCVIACVIMSPQVIADQKDQATEELERYITNFNDYNKQITDIEREIILQKLKENLNTLKEKATPVSQRKKDVVPLSAAKQEALSIKDDIELMKLKIERTALRKTKDVSLTPRELKIKEIKEQIEIRDLKEKLTNKNKPVKPIATPKAPATPPIAAPHADTPSAITPASSVKPKKPTAITIETEFYDYGDLSFKLKAIINDSVKFVDIPGNYKVGDLVKGAWRIKEISATSVTFVNNRNNSIQTLYFQWDP